MAWIVTLALFWAIGTLITRNIDTYHRVQFQQYQDTKYQGELFLARTYVLAWYFYQQIEPQVMEALAQTQDSLAQYISIPCSAEMNRFSKKVFGESIRHRAIRESLQKQAELGWTMYTLTMRNNPNATGTEWRIARANELNMDKEADILGDRIPNLGYCYAWDIAEKVKDGSVASYIPQKDDPRTYQYKKPVHTSNGLEWVVSERLR